MDRRQKNSFDWLRHFSGHPTHAVIALGLVMLPIIIVAVKW